MPILATAAALLRAAAGDADRQPAPIELVGTFQPVECKDKAIKDRTVLMPHPECRAKISLEARRAGAAER